MSKIYTSVEELVGKTPLAELTKIEREHSLSARLLAKLEGFNPAGSVKDRVAREMLDKAEKDGLIKEGSVIIEPTSGNTGIGLASIGTSRGYRTIIVMPDNMSKERKMLIRAYGAELVLTDGALGMSGAIAMAEQLHKQIPNSIIAGQFTNPANSLAHYKTTGPEIYSDTDGEVDIFVAGVGTGGTITGVGKYLKEVKPSVKVVAVEPSGSPVLSAGRSGAHGIAGIGAGFIPKVLDTEIYDEVAVVSEENAYESARECGKREGILIGISSGASLSVAIDLAKREENRGKTIVVLFPDSVDKYLSTPLFDIE